MAKIDCELHGDFFTVLQDLDNAVRGGSVSATYEDGGDANVDGVFCASRVYERYSWIGGNRVSLSITLVGNREGRLHLTAVTSGGSQAMFFKINTFGEEAFLDTIRQAVERYRVTY